MLSPEWKSVQVSGEHYASHLTEAKFSNDVFGSHRAPRKVGMSGTNRGFHGTPWQPSDIHPLKMFAQRQQRSRSAHRNVNCILQRSGRGLHKVRCTRALRGQCQKSWRTAADRTSTTWNSMSQKSGPYGSDTKSSSATNQSSTTVTRQRQVPRPAPRV